MIHFAQETVSTKKHAVSRETKSTVSLQVKENLHSKQNNNEFVFSQNLINLKSSSIQQYNNASELINTNEMFIAI